MQGTAISPFSATKKENLPAWVGGTRTGRFNGQGGIRTHEAVTPTRVPVVLLQPLGHLSNTCFGNFQNRFSWVLKRRQGEIRTLDTVARMTVFETVAFNHSATCPNWVSNCHIFAARHILSNFAPSVSFGCQFVTWGFMFGAMTSTARGTISNVAGVNPKISPSTNTGRAGWHSKRIFAVLNISTLG